jgi:hypothetical protein
LLGNHDIPYFLGKTKSYISGFRPLMVWDLHDLFKSNKEFFSAAFQIDNYIWTHAGIHKGWYNKYIPNAIKEYNLTGNIADNLNKLFEYEFEPLHKISLHRGGIAKEGGIFWADWNELYKKPLSGYNQIFGHTYKPKKIIKTYTFNENTSITNVDIGYTKKFYTIIK